MSEHFVTFDEVQTKVVRRTVRIELLHCPFCGGEAGFRVTKEWQKGGSWGVRCKECGAMTALRAGADAKVRAAEIWNRRAKL